MIYKRVVPQNYQQVFSTEQPTWFIAHHNFTDCEIDIFDYEAEDFSGMLKSSKFYYEGHEENVIKGDMFTILAGNDNGSIWEMKITDEYKLYYDGKVTLEEHCHENGKIAGENKQRGIVKDHSHDFQNPMWFSLYLLLQLQLV